MKYFHTTTRDILKWFMKNAKKEGKTKTVKNKRRHKVRPHLRK